MNFVIAAVMMAIGMGHPAAETYSKNLLSGANEIINRAKASGVIEPASAVRSQLEKYMRASDVHFPATFPVAGGEVTIHKFEEDTNEKGQSRLVMVLSKSTDPTPRRVILYTEMNTDPL